jgi:hypothetical protein
MLRVAPRAVQVEEMNSLSLADEPKACAPPMSASAALGRDDLQQGARVLAASLLLLRKAERQAADDRGGASSPLGSPPSSK